MHCGIVFKSSLVIRFCKLLGSWSVYVDRKNMLRLSIGSWDVYAFINKLLCLFSSWLHLILSSVLSSLFLLLPFYFPCLNFLLFFLLFFFFFSFFSFFFFSSSFFFLIIFLLLISFLLCYLLLFPLLSLLRTFLTSLF